MKARNLLLLFALLMAPVASIASEFQAVTPSGSTEMFFSGSSADTVDTISSKCMDAQWKVMSSTNTEVVCESALGFGQSMVSQLLLGNSYSTPPRRFVRFNMSEIRGVSRVQASGWIETQMAFGQVKRADLSGPDFHNFMMGFMADAGGVFPAGTTFPNHAFMGVYGKFLQRGKSLAYEVIEVTPGAAASRADLQLGDQINRIAGRSFKDANQFLDATARAAKTASYAIDIIRDGRSITLTLDREFRQATTETVASIAVQDQRISPSTNASPLSVADELSKLFQLKEQGILTQEEFDLQKAKILAR